ncbi:hypothetical protein M9H77_10762 [Catharanthus roseus]|uniref:Uncharacterized protein n=1 Tax=Catharanthus roseus TaxID=4058 RepID=A0ACC0BCN4_CATRO|nr:hypothetical protein M9H77_10762 [Catharanthus roseus]
MEVENSITAPDFSPNYKRNNKHEILIEEDKKEARRFNPKKKEREQRKQVFDHKITTESRALTNKEETPGNFRGFYKPRTALVILICFTYCPMMGTISTMATTQQQIEKQDTR